jgi:hypothetical protein
LLEIDFKLINKGNVMKKLLLSAVMFAALGASSIAIAADANQSHMCVCNERARGVRNAEFVDCNALCGKGKWTGRASFSNSKKFKGITCSCTDGKTATKSCEALNTCYRSGWAGKVYSDKANADIDVPEGDDTKLDNNGIISTGY